MSGTVNASGYGLFFPRAENDGDFEVMQRLIGHALLAYLPAVELSDTIETLSECYSFHATPARVEPEVSLRIVTGKVTAEPDAWSVVG